MQSQEWNRIDCEDKLDYIFMISAISLIKSYGEADKALVSKDFHRDWVKGQQNYVLVDRSDNTKLILMGGGVSLNP